MAMALSIAFSSVNVDGVVDKAADSNGDNIDSVVKGVVMLLSMAVVL